MSSALTVGAHCRVWFQESGNSSAPRAELYNLIKDPREQHNLFAPDDPRSQELSAQLEGVLKALLESHLPAASLGELNENSLRTLHSLGYIGTSSDGTSSTDEEAQRQRADPKDKVDEHRQLNEVITLVEQDHIPETLDLLVKLIKSRAPGVDEYVLATLGQALINENRYTEAIVPFQGVLAIPPKHVAVRWQLGNAYRELDEFKAAVEYYWQAIRPA